MTIYNILICLLSIYLIYVLLNIILQFICSCDTKENFVDNYYKWDWNNPNVIKYMNMYTTDNNCTSCSYSQSCHLTDDAQPFCNKSYDIPSINNNLLTMNSF